MVGDNTNHKERFLTAKTQRAQRFSLLGFAKDHNP